MVDAIVREWMQQVMGPEAAAEGVGLEIRNLLECFYVDDRIIALRDPVFLQECIDKLATLFDRFDLVTNITKTQSMTFLPGNIRGFFLMETYKKRMDGTAIRAPRGAYHARSAGLC